jgi:xanthine dehydrogenase accessory factor
VLLYSSDGRIAGNISGGCVEAAAAQEIDRARKTGRAHVVSYGITDAEAWGIGLACGGTIDVLIEPTVPAEAIAAARRPDGAVVVTTLPTDDDAAPLPRLTYEPARGFDGMTGDAALDTVLTNAADDALRRGSSRVAQAGDRGYFVEAFPVNPRLVIVGAVEIARALVRLGHELGFETIVVDGRPAFATRERFLDADLLLLGWFDEVAGEIGLSRNDSVVVLAHDPKFDEPAIIEALKRNCRYVGAIGSKKTQAERRARLRDSGLAEADVARLHGPIGLDLGGRSPAETGLAILAEIVAARYGASRQSLRDLAASQAVNAS